MKSADKSMWKGAGVLWRGKSRERGRESLEEKQVGPANFVKVNEADAPSTPCEYSSEKQMRGCDSQAICDAECKYCTDCAADISHMK